MKSLFFIFAVLGVCVSRVSPVLFFVGGEYPPYEDVSVPKFDDIEDSITTQNTSSLFASNTTVNGTKTTILTGGTFSDIGDYNISKLSNTSLAATNKTVNETDKISNQTVKTNNNETSNSTNKTATANETATTTTTSKPTEKSVTNNSVSTAVPHNTTETVKNSTNVTAKNSTNVTAKNSTNVTANNSTNVTAKNSTNVTSESKTEMKNLTGTAKSSNATAALKMEPNTTNSSHNGTTVSNSEVNRLNVTGKTAASANATEAIAKFLNDTKNVNETSTKIDSGNTTETTTVPNTKGPSVHNDTTSKNLTKRNAEFQSRINYKDNIRIKLDNKTATESPNVSKNGTDYINGTVCDVINGTEICDYFNSTSENVNGNEVIKIMFGSKTVLDLADGTETYEYIIIEEEYDEGTSVEETTPSTDLEER